jgi:hypothetical protein
MAGSIRMTAYPAVAPAPNAGVNTRAGLAITPSATASRIASGMLAADVLPTRPRLKYSRSASMEASRAARTSITLFA